MVIAASLCDIPGMQPFSHLNGTFTEYSYVEFHTSGMITALVQGASEHVGMLGRGLRASGTL
jgi:hypothetical protein